MRMYPAKLAVVALICMSQSAVTQTARPMPDHLGPEYLHIKDKPIGDLWLRNRQEYKEIRAEIQRNDWGIVEIRARYRQYGQTSRPDNEVEAILDTLLFAISQEPPDYETIRLTNILAEKGLSGNQEYAELLESFLISLEFSDLPAESMGALFRSVTWLTLYAEPTHPISEHGVRPAYWRERGFADTAPSGLGKRLSYRLAIHVIKRLTENASIEYADEVITNLNADLPDIRAVELEFIAETEGESRYRARGPVPSQYDEYELEEYEFHVMRAAENIELRKASMDYDWIDPAKEDQPEPIP